MLGRILATMRQIHEACVCRDKSQFLKIGMSCNLILFLATLTVLQRLVDSAQLK